jgi:hypothetical protein
MMPSRYLVYFQPLRETYENGTWEMKWKCRRCGKVIKRNTAGAQSHLAKHLREETGRCQSTTSR